MTAGGHVVPPALRPARFVPRQSPGRREPARVTAGAFRAAGLPVPEDRRQHNAYQLSRRQGWPWSPRLDEHVRRRGAELLGGDRFVCVDLDVQLAVDGTVWLDGLRWLTDAGARNGELLDVSVCVAVRTPGHAHAPGWHLWYRADPDHPVRTGPLRQCRVVEVKTRCTCPGSPGYEIRYAPAEVPVLPQWIAELAGPPRLAAVRAASSAGYASSWRRLRGVVAFLLDAEHGERNQSLYWAARTAAEIGGSAEATERVLLTAAGRIGLVAEDGEAAVLATIRSGMTAAAQPVTGGAA